MAKTYQIITDSSCDLSAELAAALDVIVLPLQFTLDGTQYLNDTSPNGMENAEFYRRLRSGSHIQTSAVNPAAFEAAMEGCLQSGLDVLYLGFSSGLSTTYQSGCIAADALRERYPERRILTLDSLCASLGQGLFVTLAAKKQQSGASLDEVYADMTALRPRLCHWFTLSDLMFLKRGGRISAATAVAGTVLGIQPVLHMDDDGHLASVTKIRGHKNALRALAKKVAEEAVDPASQTVFICHGDCLEDAEFIAAEIRKLTSVKDIYIDYVGPVIGAHTGHGVVSVFYLGEHR